MKKSLILITFFYYALQAILGQTYSENFEGFKFGDYLGVVSKDWTTMSGTAGGNEDIQINDINANSGKNSLFYESPNGGGPQNVVLPFNAFLSSGKFKFSSMFFIPRGNQAAFNFQADSVLGNATSMEFILFDNGTFDVNGLTGGYPTDRWFEIRIEVDLDANSWDVIVDNRFQGNFSSRNNTITYFNLFAPNPNSIFWIDDVSYCINEACNPDIALRSLSINNNPICSNNVSDVTLSISNNGPHVALGFELALLMKGQNFIKHKIVLDSLKAGMDTIITIPQLFITNLNGNKIEVIAVNNDHDVNLENDTLRTLIDVNATPYGSELIKGNIYQGKFRKGTQEEPDLLETSMTNSYALTAPSLYTNSDYNTEWKISSLVARTTYGMIVPSNNYQFNFPTNTNNGNLQITAKEKYIDSTVTFYFTLQNINTSCDTIIQRSIQIVPVAKIEFFSPDSVCAGNSIAFENKTNIHSGQTTSMWYFGDNDSSDNTNPTHTYVNPGTYQVKLVITNFPYGFISDTIFTIHVVEKPVVKFSAINKCEGNIITFNNLTNISNGTLNYIWDFGDNSPNVRSLNAQHLYDTAGAYNVILTASGNGCIASFSKKVFQFPIPKVDFSFPTRGFCADAEAILSNLTTIAFGKSHPFWDFGDGSYSSQVDGKHIFKASGTYSVTLKSLSDFGCSDSITKDITIFPTPVPSFTTDQFCDGEPTTFTNTSTNKSLPIVMYNWVLSDGYTSFQQMFRHTWPAPGKYTVTLNAKSINGCASSITQEIEVYHQPEVDFEVQDICLGESAIFENLTRSQNGDVKYLWNFGNNLNSEETFPTIQYALPGVYTVQLTASHNNPCSVIMQKNIVVNDTPQCNFNFINKGNMNFSFAPNDSSNANYTWLFGDGSSSSNISPDYTYAIGGSYRVTMRATNAAGCDCEITKTISASTGINSNAIMNGIEIYPNPSNGVFTVKNLDGKKMNVQVFNMIGGKIYDQSTDSIELSVNLTEQVVGVYLVTVSIDGIQNTYKIVITN